MILKALNVLQKRDHPKSALVTFLYERWPFQGKKHLPSPTARALGSFAGARAFGSFVLFAGARPLALLSRLPEPGPLSVPGSMSCLPSKADNNDQRRNRKRGEGGSRGGDCAADSGGGAFFLKGPL